MEKRRLNLRLMLRMIMDIWKHRLLSRFRNPNRYLSKYFLSTSYVANLECIATYLAIHIYDGSIATYNFPDIRKIWLQSRRTEKEGKREIRNFWIFFRVEKWPRLKDFLSWVLTYWTQDKSSRTTRHIRLQLRLISDDSIKIIIYHIADFYLNA